MEIILYIIIYIMRFAIFSNNVFFPCKTKNRIKKNESVHSPRFSEIQLGLHHISYRRSLLRFVYQVQSNVKLWNVGVNRYKTSSMRKMMEEGMWRSERYSNWVEERETFTTNQELRLTLRFLAFLRARCARKKDKIIRS